MKGIKIFLFLFVLFQFFSCNTTKYLGNDEYLLRGNYVKLKSKEKIKNKPSLKYELSLLFKQRKNTKLLLLIPREWIYFKTQDPQDTTKFDIWQRRVLAESPTIYNDSLTAATVKAMEIDLQQKGFYNAHVYSDDYVKGKKAYVNYYVNPGKQFTVDSITFFSSDPNIEKEVRKISNNSYFKKGNPLDNALYLKERDRIVKHLQNNGYAYFFPNYITPIEADTFGTQKKATLFLEITPPFSDTIHHTYSIGKIEIYPNYSPILNPAQYRDTIIEGYHFIDTSFHFEIKPEVILDAIYLKEGNLYSLSDKEKTNRRLSALGIYKFVRIKQEIDSLQKDVINFSIELSLNKRLELRFDLELNYTNNNSVGRAGNLFGLTTSPSLRNKNQFGGAELLISNLTGGIEFNPALNGPRFWNSIDLGAQTELFLPKFSDYFRIWKSLDKIRFGKKVKPVNQRFYTALKENALSRFSASYNYVLVLQFYRYNLFNASFGYDMQLGNTKRYIINHIGLDYLFPIPEPLLEQIFKDNPFFERSFGKQLFTSFLFRDFTYVYNSRVSNNGESNHASINFETAGSEVWAINKLSNAIQNKQDTFSLGDVAFSQYIKASLDLRYFKQITPKQSFAIRGFIGVARPFGFSGDVPYIKQFSAGGPNSIRAWVQRGLGPGGYLDTLAHNVNDFYRLDRNNRLKLYQQGDIKLELNFEYRFNLYWLLDGAFFVDAGNIWTIQEDPTRCGSQFRFNKKTIEGCEEEGIANDPFYKQIAIGTGFGLRFDFNYFILRLDLGLRLRYPFPINRSGNITEPDYWNNFRELKLKDVNFNLGFGYPF